MIQDDEAPKSDKADDPVEWWGRRLTLLIALIAFVTATAAFLGVRYLGPGPRLDALEQGKVVQAGIDSAIRDSLRAVGRTAEAAQDEASASAYVGCELLRNAQPRAIPPSQCSPERQRLRSLRTR